MSYFVNNYEFNEIKALASESGTYIIVGEEKNGQLKLADILARQAYVQMNMKEMETLSLIEDIEKCLIKKDGDIIFDNVSIEYVKKYLLSINQLAKIYNSRIFLCSNDKEIKPDEMLKDVCGVIQIFLCPYTGLVELNVVIKENRRCIVDIFKNGGNKYDTVNKKLMLLKEKGDERIAYYLQKMFEEREYNDEMLEQMIIDCCFKQIYTDRNSSNIVLRQVDFKKFEFENGRYELRCAKDIVELWQNLLKYKINFSLLWALDSLIDSSRPFLFLYNKNELNRHIAMIETCEDNTICRFIYDNEENEETMKSWLEDYAEQKGFTIREDCFIKAGILNI